MRAYEKAVINFFRKAIDTTLGPATTALYEATISELETLREESSGQLLLCQEIVIWLRARIAGKALKEAFTTPNIAS
ncbi:MAG TPA: hypothetical protein ENJ82_05485 [Bacteroidetes bacterium]|nr:hypothetical protein [Bacteroidota bacterium]